MKKGELVSNAEVLSLLENAMKKVSSSKGFLIDGYPRQKDQGAAFEQAIAPVDLILYFECKDVSQFKNSFVYFPPSLYTLLQETMVARILHRASQSAEVRADDNEETIKTRIATFSKNTNEILALYPQQTRRVNFSWKIKSFCFN